MAQRVEGSVIAAYERVLRGEQSGFSPYEFQPKDRKRKIVELVRYLVEQRWQMTPEEVLQSGRMTRETLAKERLDCLLRYVEPLPEQHEQDASHLLYFAYPHLPKPDLKDRVIQVYREVLDGTRKSFPRMYFVDPEYGEDRARICVRYLCEEILKLKPEEVPTYFNRRGIAVLRQYKLKILLNMVYDSVADMLRDAYPSVFDDDSTA